MSENNCACRDKLLAEYKNNNFEPSEKLKSDNEGKKYLPLKEKLKMFRADNPDAKIICSVLVDNNIFATVQCEIITSSGGGAIASAKWYHTNTDVFGKNYLSTAQSNAVSIALKLLGYDDTQDEEEPNGEQNIGDIKQLPFILDENQGYRVNPLIKECPKEIVTNPKNSISVNQARTIRVANQPFANRTIGDILDNDGPENIKKLKAILEFSIKHNTPLSVAAKVILPILQE